MKKSVKKTLLIVTVGIISLMTFALWKLINLAVEDLLLKIGVVNAYAQLGAILLGGLLLILLVFALVKKKTSIWNVLKDVFKL